MQESRQEGRNALGNKQPLPALLSFPHICTSHLVSYSGEGFTQAGNFSQLFFLETPQLFSNHMLSLSLSLLSILFSSPRFRVIT